MQQKLEIQSEIDFCNLIRISSILHKIHGNKRHNQYVLKILQQENNNLIDLSRKSKIISKIPNSMIITDQKNKLVSKVQIQPKKIQNGEDLSYSQIQSQLYTNNKTNNHKTKKKNNKFQKSRVSKVSKGWKLGNLQETKDLRQVLIKSTEKVDQLQQSKLSLKQLIRQEQILKDIYKINTTNIININKSTTDLRQLKYNQSSDRQYRRSQSTSPKNIVKVKTPVKQQFTPIQQFQQIIQQNHDRQKQINVVKHRSQIWPHRKKEDIIQKIQAQNSKKKLNLPQRNSSPQHSRSKNIKNKSRNKQQITHEKNTNKSSEIKGKKQTQQGKFIKNINIHFRSKSPQKKSQQQNLHQLSNYNHVNQQGRTVKVSINLHQNKNQNKNQDKNQKLANKKQHKIQEKQDHQDQYQNENQSQFKQCIKIPTMKLKQKPEPKAINSKQNSYISEKIVQETIQSKQSQSKQKQHHIDINRLYIKSLGNKYLESIFSEYIPTNDK